MGQVFADSHDVGLVQIERGLAWHYKAYEREQRPEDTQAYAQAEVEPGLLAGGCGSILGQCRRGSGVGRRLRTERGSMRRPKMGGTLAAFVIVAFILNVSPTFAGDFEDATAAYRRGDYVTALRLIRPLAQQGHSIAQYNLGLMYEKGEGVAQDSSVAVEWYRMAAQQGYASAQHDLGVSYYKGEGVAQDYKEAEKWFRLAAQQGYASSQSSLSVMYLNRSDYKEALKWVQLSANRGHAPAQVNLGLMYYNGQGVTRDYVRAHMWVSLAALQGDPNAMNSRDIIAKKMSPAQIAEAQRLARDWNAK